MSKLYTNYSASTSWRSREFDRKERKRKEDESELINKYNSMEIPTQVKDRWRILKAKYPHLQIRREYDLWLEARRKKGRAEIHSPMLALKYFEEDRLINKPGPSKPMPTEAELEVKRTTYLEKERQIIQGLLSDCGINFDFSIKELLHTAVYKEELNHYSIQDWIKGEGSKPVYPSTKELYQIVVKHKAE